ncbi:MAG: DMT family transporter [Clostridiales Family XIII bacterium]|jgi:drug/metabolite transporter (DMT)-like permease|nr:DMT family transporter [Clostridiales Family XIII bacterium]
MLREERSEKTAYILMISVIFLWGFEYVVAKRALIEISTMSLVCLKYSIGVISLLCLKFATRTKFKFRKKDIFTLIACAVFGDILYFACEYKAMSYLPVSVITVILAFVPAVSVLFERFAYHRKANARIYGGIAAGIVGVALVIGVNLGLFFSGAVLGYVLTISAVFLWNIYNFFTAKLVRDYQPLDLALYQTVCAALLSLPFLLRDLPPLSVFTGEVLASVLYLGVISEGLCFIIYVYSIKALGPTRVSVFSNMLTITSTFFGWLMLGEQIKALQLVGAGVVIVSACVVILEKGKLMKQYGPETYPVGRPGHPSSGPEDDQR